ncbi:SCP-like protein, partial [Ancylostoma caninum]
FEVLLNSYATATTTYYPTDVCSDTITDLFRLEIMAAHNALRGQLARGEIEQDDGSKLKGSKTLFKLNYDCTLEGLAMAAVPTNCARQPAMDLNPLGRSQNLAAVTANNDPSTGQPLQTAINSATTLWAERLHVELLKNPIYTNERMAPFANMIYNNSLSMGCMGYYCSAQTKTAIVCVYSDM